MMIYDNNMYTVCTTHASHILIFKYYFKTVIIIEKVLFMDVKLFHIYQYIMSQLYDFMYDIISIKNVCAIFYNCIVQYNRDFNY